MRSRPTSPRSSPRRAVLTAVPTLALFACGGEATELANAVVEDSAGVRIVQHVAAPHVDSPFAFAPEPVYRHGNNPGDHMFARIWTGILLGDGSAAVFDAASSEVVHLNPDGTFQSVLAPAGEGPGEVTMVTSMFGVGPDGVLVVDFVAEPVLAVRRRRARPHGVDRGPPARHVALAEGDRRRRRVPRRHQFVPARVRGGMALRAHGPVRSGGGGGRHGRVIRVRAGRVEPRSRHGIRLRLGADSSSTCGRTSPRSSGVWPTAR